MEDRRPLTAEELEAISQEGQGLFEDLFLKAALGMPLLVGDDATAIAFDPAALAVACDFEDLVDTYYDE